MLIVMYAMLFLVYFSLLIIMGEIKKRDYKMIKKIMGKRDRTPSLPFIAALAIPFFPYLTYVNSSTVYSFFSRIPIHKSWYKR